MKGKEIKQFEIKTSDVAKVFARIDRVTSLKRQEAERAWCNEVTNTVFNFFLENLQNLNKYMIAYFKAKNNDDIDAIILHMVEEAYCDEWHHKAVSDKNLDMMRPSFIAILNCSSHDNKTPRSKAHLHIVK